MIVCYCSRLDLFAMHGDLVFVLSSANGSFHNLRVSMQNFRHPFCALSFSKKKVTNIFQKFRKESLKLLHSHIRRA